MRKSKFRLTHLHSTTLDPGYLVPFCLIPTLPNDSFRLGLSTFIRAQPMLAPLMHEVRLFTQYWFVPNRIIWEEWEDFITGGNDLSLTPPFPTVKLTADDCKTGSLTDYFGFPLVQDLEVSALPYRAMAEIWNTRYRDEDLQEEVAIDYGSSEDTTTSRKLLSPSFSKDYFTTARPFTQRGGDIAVPVQNNIGGVSPRGKRVSFSVVACQHTVASSGSNIARLNACNTTAQGYNYDSIVAALNQWFQDHKDDIDTLVGSVPAYAENQTTRDFFTSAFMNPRKFYDTGAFSQYLVNGNTVNVGWSFYVFIDNVSVFEQSTPVVEGFSVPAFTSATCPSPQMLVSRGYLDKAAFPFYPGGGTVWNQVDGLGATGGSGSQAYVATYNWFENLQRGEYQYQLSAGTGETGIYIRDLRKTAATQRYAERSLRYGNRYEEFIQREFGIKPRDYRIQRPEYLGGGAGILNISEVLQTAESTDTGVGTMRGHGVASVSQRPIRFRCPEHGIILGLLSIRPKSVYTQGIDREWLKRSRLDFFTPELANIGMQEVLQQELFATPNNGTEVFGYSERYQEYRYQKPLVTGEFRTTLNFWNMARLFANAPNLNAEFIDMSKAVDDFKRPFQIQDNSAHSFVCMLKNHVRAYRPIPKRAKDILR